ncbi:Caffeyl-CoA reductase-Etf complex subunit CarC [Methylobacterium crusticola]|uniref:Caffeyl-CoA reductase-Etf complex subunit CarC n=1 Tax=Methylobacterium crusticola TaxID=1697972 RepID=A0ABQ4QWJ0_9HYPH|nr:acyl-CoA dehydrogenase family protein [Methylobacterium crusticola]GJD49738.1 Caffeyl-CoA reductase-Etf complex subunit CarC [Methylobacterium crusticola]
MRRSPDQRDDDHQLREGARRFLEARCSWSPARPSPAALDALQREMARLGWFAMGLPDSLGGAGADALQCLSVVEEAGRVLLRRSLAADVLVAPRLMRRGLDALAELAPGLAAGEVRFALVPEDPAKGGLSVARTAAGVTLRGRSATALDAETATHWLVQAGGRSPNGATLLCVEAVGPAAQPRRLIDGRAGAVLTFEGVDLPAGAVLATGHDALALIAEIEDCAAAALVADAYGALAAGLDLTVGYLNQRRQFGQTLGAFQAVQHLMADAFCDLETLRSLMLWTAAALEGEPAERRRAATTAKVALGREGLAAASRLIQASGGIAMTEDYRVGHVYKRLQVAAGLHGGTEAQLRQLATDTLSPKGRQDDEASAA